MLGTNGMSLLQNGQRFPAVTLSVVGGTTLTLPDDLCGGYGVVLIYRGSWCPYCMAQLSSFGRALNKLKDVNAKVVALSVDDESTSTATREKYGLPFPLGYDVDAHQIASLVGCYTSTEPSYLESTGFVLDPDGIVLNAVYSSGAIGRLTAADVVGFLRYVQAEE